MNEGQGAQVRIVQHPHQVIEQVFTGVIDVKALQEVNRLVDHVFVELNGSLAILANTLDVEGFLPGIPALSVQFGHHRRNRTSAVAVVARRPAIVAVARALSYLIAPIPMDVFATHEEAMAWLLQKQLRVSPSARVRRKREGSGAHATAPVDSAEQDATLHVSGVKARGA